MAQSKLTEQGTEFLMEKNYEKALAYYKQAADEDDYFAMYNIACMYYFGDGVDKNEHTSFEWYVKASNAGDAEAANRVAIMYENGIGTEQNIEQAYNYYELSAKSGSLSGMANYGMCFLNGKGTKQDAAQAIEWLERASKNGNGVASLKLASLYLAEEENENEAAGITQNPALAAACLERGMCQKYAPAIKKLAQLYEQGRGVEKDVKKAEELKELAANTPDED